MKLRGFRIEPGEIEAVLRRHQQVREAVVVLKRRTEISDWSHTWWGMLRLVSYVNI